MSILFYRLVGRCPVPCSLEEFADQISKMNRRVEETLIGEKRVSTVFLGLDHRFSVADTEHKPLLFETMIFHDEDGIYMTRCETWDEAEEMHRQAVAVAMIWHETSKAEVERLMPELYRRLGMDN